MVMQSDIGYSRKPKKRSTARASSGRSYSPKGLLAGAAIKRLARSGAKNAGGKLGGGKRYTPKPPSVTRRSSSPQRSNSRATGVNPAGRVGSNSYTPAGGIGGGSYGSVAPPVAPPSLESFLAGDTAWMSQQDQFAKALKDYETEMNRQKSVYETDYNASLDDLGVSKEAALGDLEGDFAGRGLLNSGLYADSMAQLEADYLARQTGLETGRSNFLSELTSAFTDFQSEQELATQRARQEAANRRAAKYGL